MSSQELPAAERIRHRPEFQHVYDTGTRAHGRFMTVFVVPNDIRRSRFGVAATRKIGSAVDRNRAKRLAREIYRRHKVAAGHDIVVVPRREMLDAPFANLETDYVSTLLRCSRSPRPAPRPGRPGRHRVDTSV
jgi:ribonuclease P protein component